MSSSHHQRPHGPGHGPYTSRGPYAPPGGAPAAGPGVPHRTAGSAAARRQRVAARARHELAQADRHGLLPIAGGLAIDVVDFATMGPIGVFAGALVGGLVTWTVASRHGLSSRMIAMMTFLGALYCTVPFTELLPLATLLAIVSRLLPAAADTTTSSQVGPAFDPGEAARAVPTVRVHQAGVPRR